MVEDKKFSQTKNTKKTYPTLTPDNNADKAELFAESMERHFGFECNNFNGTNLRETISMAQTLGKSTSL